MTYPSFIALERGYARLWAGLEPMPEHMPALKTICGELRAHKATYCEIAQTVWGKPDSWFVVALLDAMEHGAELGLCNSHLHNGDPLTHRTVDVPAGRPRPPATPPFSFHDSAVDALRYQGLDQVAAWTVERLAYWLEVKWNGTGYIRRPGENPYLVAWSGEETAGKYTSDHHYDPRARSGQPGALTILKILITMDPTIAAALAPAQPQESTMPATQTAPAAQNILSEVEQALEAANSWLPGVLQWAGVFFPPAAALAKFLPLIQTAIQGVQIVQQATGQNTPNAMMSVINHNTPGQKDSRPLSGD